MERSNILILLPPPDISHMYLMLLIFFKKVQRKEALKNEMPVVLEITYDKGTISHHVTKTETTTTKKPNKQTKKTTLIK